MNGTPIQEDSTYNEQVVLTVRGTDLYGSHYGVYRIANGERVEYTPLGGTYDAPEYILQDNGVYEVVANGEVVRILELSGITLPVQEYASIVGSLRKDITTVGLSQRTTERFLNFPHKVNDEYPFVGILLAAVSGGTVDINKVSIDNGTRASTVTIPSLINTIIRPINPDSVVVVRYNGYIVLVANYYN